MPRSLPAASPDAVLNSLRGRRRLPRRNATGGLGHLVRRHAGRRDVPELDQLLSIVGERCLPSGHGEPDVRRHVVTRDTGPIEVQLSELILRTKIVAVGTLAVPARGLSGICRNRATLAVELADGSLRRGAAVLRRLAVPRERLLIVSRDSEPEVVQLPHLEFSRR